MTHRAPVEVTGALYPREESDMPKRNYTREILAQVKAGRVPVNSVGPTHTVDYAPRRKYDPQPWTDGTYRYSGREVHTEARCGKPVSGMRTVSTDPCGLPDGHEGRVCSSRPGGYIRYTYS